MTPVQTAPFGSWKSTITSDMIASGSVRISNPVIDGDDMYWLEMRPAEGGRSVLVRRDPDGMVHDVTSSSYNVRTRVHEYGGSAFLIEKGTIYFSNFADQRLYRQEQDSIPVPITPESALRFADGMYDRRRKRIICVCEDHSIDGQEPVNTLAGVDSTGTRDIVALVNGNDFYSSPRISPEGTRLCWLTWNHPDMPWDGTELWAGDIDADGSIVNKVHVAGSRTESICQPKYSPDGVLYFISDRNGWWNLYRWIDGDIEPVIEMEAEFGEPDWIFGRSNYDFVAASRIICSYQKNGNYFLAIIDTSTGELEQVESPCTYIDDIFTSREHVVYYGGSPVLPGCIISLDTVTGKSRILKKSIDSTIDPAYLSEPQAIEFPTEHGLSSHAVVYPPMNRDFAASAGEKPPLLVISHGGPTANTSSILNLSVQYWTSRGFAVVDVDYGGSTGYGRAYRERLNGAWGIVDVEDCVNAAKYPIGRGEADAERIAIRGSSAGGYTTLAALTFNNIFKAGASYYGVSDLEALAKDTHKFESRYLDRLIGPYPEGRDLYLERSPIHHIEGLSCPVIFFQGTEDKVVPPNQAEMMVEALRKKGVPVAYVLFEGEQHGFRQAQNIKRALDAELYFYSRIFGFDLAEPVEPVEIENL